MFFLLQLGFLEISLKDLIDISLVTILIYNIYKLIRNSGVLQVFVGALFLYVSYLIINAFQMTLLSQILGQFIEVGVVAAIIIFQKEIRKFLLFVGNSYFVNLSYADFFLFWKRKKHLNYQFTREIKKALADLSFCKEGALIVIARNGMLQDLKEVIETGIQLDALISERLILNIFFKNSPLHDGAMIIESDRIAAAGCILPVSENSTIPAYFGLRHRAGVGITETHDVLVLCASEETGKISMIQNGEIRSDIPHQNIENMIEGFLNT